MEKQAEGSLSGEFSKEKNYQNKRRNYLNLNFSLDFYDYPWSFDFDPYRNTSLNSRLILDTAILAILSAYRELLV